MSTRLRHWACLVTATLNLTAIACGETSIVALDRQSADCAPPSSGEPALLAADFSDFVGVGLRLGYGATAYADVHQVQAALVELGVRHVADVADDAVQLDSITETNVSTLLLDARATTPPALSPSAARKLDLVQLMQPRLSAQAQLADWQTAIDHDIAALRQALHDRPDLAAVRLVAPALPKSVLHGVATALVNEVDLALVTQWPGASNPGDAQLQAAIDDTDLLFGGRPRVMTQVGYSTSLAGEVGAQPSVESELVQAKYTARLLLTLFRRGWERVYLAQLCDWSLADSAFEDRLGLVRADFTRKPAFVVVRNLLQLLSGPRPATLAGKLSYRWVGDTSDLRQLLFQDGAGRFYVIVWLEVPSTDATLSRQLTLDLRDPVDSVNTYHPEVSSFPLERSTAPTLAVTVTDWPTVLQITPTCPP